MIYRVFTAFIAGIMAVILWLVLQFSYHSIMDPGLQIAENMGLNTTAITTNMAPITAFVNNWLVIVFFAGITLYLLVSHLKRGQTQYYLD